LEGLLMKTTIARWTIALAAATIIALPAAGFAQNAPQSQPPATQPATPDQPQAQPQPQPASNEAAKAHLTAARNSLSEITQLPAAAQLQGEARMQVSQLITSFNELITTQADWKASYAKVEATLNALLAPATPDPARPSATPGAVGTTGSTEIDPAIRAKLGEFKTHLTKFHEVASGGAASPAPDAPAATPTEPTTPAQPPTDPPPTQPTSQTPPTTQTPPANPTSTAAQTPPAQPSSTRPDPEPGAEVDPQEVMAHVEAIEAILNANASAQAAAQSAAGGAVGTTGTATGSTRTTVTPSDVTLNQTQLQELRTHLAELRRLLEKK
jgi:hypothetical protein